MTPTERCPAYNCPACGGPCEAGAKYEYEPGEFSSIWKALPDTLEGIEADARASGQKVFSAYLYTIDKTGCDLQGAHLEYRSALARLFCGCATCGRKPLASEGRARDLLTELMENLDEWPIAYFGACRDRIRAYLSGGGE